MSTAINWDIGPVGAGISFGRAERSDPGGAIRENSTIGFAAVFGAMFVIANPFSGIPYLLGYSSPLTNFRQRILAALLTSVTVWVGGALVIFAGKAVRGFFGVSIPGLRVGGGLVILFSGLAMMKTTVDASKKVGPQPVEGCPGPGAQGTRGARGPAVRARLVARSHSIDPCK